MTLRTVNSGLGSELTTNFISDPSVKPLYLNTRVGGFVGLNFYGFQGEIHFSRPETNLKNRYTSGVIRYINRPKYESFALGRRAGHRSRRLNKNWLLDLDANILMGFCRWKYIEKDDPTLYQLFDFEVSSIQSLVYSPLNKSGITFRAGLIENVSYVIDRIPALEVGLYGEIGYKF
jgi:hypothetical protein